MVNARFVGGTPITPSPRTTVPYAAFPLCSPAGEEVGASLRRAGMPEQQHQQEKFHRKRNQAGSQPTQGFWQSHEAPQPQTLVLVEAPIDGMALYATKDWAAAWAQWVSFRTPDQELESEYEPGD